MVQFFFTKVSWLNFVQTRRLGRLSPGLLVDMYVRAYIERYVCMHMCIYIYIPCVAVVYVYKHTCMNVYMKQICVHTCVYTHTYTHTCSHNYIKYIYIHTCSHNYINKYMCIYRYAHMYANIQTRVLLPSSMNCQARGRQTSALPTEPRRAIFGL